MTPTDQPTPAELRALRAFVKAGSAKDAALELHCAPQTVKNHLFTLRQKLGVHSTLQAALLLRDELAA